MKFRLKYEGPLKTNGSKNHKHEIRKAFHPQLKNLLENSGLLNILNKANFMNPENEKSIIKKVGNFQFVNLVSSQIGLIAELDIIFMRPEEPGKIINSGDIDNRIKTLFDALRYPKEEQDLPSEEISDSSEHPLFCLLEDDALVSSVNITTDRLLEAKNPSDVFLLIHVNIKPARHAPKTWIHLEFL